MWSHRAICEACADALRAEECRRCAEQSPYGVDALDELELHAVVRAGLRTSGFTVLAEQRYPDHRARRRRSEGDRCDIVLVPSGGAHLLDPLAADTLFGDRGVNPADAYWLEVKIARQFALTDGVAGAGRQYTQQLLSAATADVRKLSRDAVIEFAGLLLVLFTRDVATAEHDLSAWMTRCLDRDLPVSAPFVEQLHVTDRLGNAHAHIAVIPVGRASSQP